MSDVAVNRIVKEAERREITQIGRTRWRELELAGKAPRRLSLGPRARGWRLLDLIRFVESLPPVDREPAA